MASNQKFLDSAFAKIYKRSRIPQSDVKNISNILSNRSLHPHKTITATQSKTKFITVSQLQQKIRKNYREDPTFQNIYLRAGISSMSKEYGHPGFHFKYITLEDLKNDKDTIAAFVRKSVYNKLPTPLKVGDKVDIISKLSVSKRSESQLNVQKMMPAGLSDLYVKLVRTKRELAKEHVFDASHKKPLVKFPKRIAVVTSRQGAVIRDIIETARLRDSSVQIILFPASVASASQMITQIKRADKKNCDAIIVGRGGGSKKDLQPFNNKNLALTVYHCKTPVISSVGHSVDHPIIDDVADKKVVTPTAAAEVATPNIPEIRKKVNDLIKSITSITRNLIKDCSNQYKELINIPIYQNPIDVFIKQRQDKVKNLQNSIENNVKLKLYKSEQNATKQIERLNKYSPKQIIANISAKVKIEEHNIQQIVKEKINQSQSQLNSSLNKLNALSPKPLINNATLRATNQEKLLHTYFSNILKHKTQLYQSAINRLNDNNPTNLMKRGYTYTTTKRGKIITKINQMRKNQIIKVHTVSGYVDAKVRSVHKDKRRD